VLRSERHWRAVLALLGFAAFVVAAQSEWPIRARTRAWLDNDGGSSIPIGKRVEIPTPLGLPPVPIPEDNPPTAETIALGRKLFFDPILSVDGTIACASCHDPKHGFADPKPVSTGVYGRKGKRNAMSILNAAYNHNQFWDGRARTLEEQAAGPVPNDLEFAHSLPGVERKLAARPDYVDLFAKAFGPGRITFEKVAKSIASYERTLVSGNSPFDRYFYGGDKTAMNDSAIRGLALYLNPSLRAANCVSCHRIDADYATFTEPRFHNTGVAVDPLSGEILDLGRYLITREERLRGAFKTPTLRNIALTAPYMHNGSMKTLEEVVEFYFKGGRANPFLSADVPRPGVTDIPRDQQPQAIKDLVEFMKALTGEIPPGAGPPDD
jgi:cytochrome c peroxidase